MGKGRFSTWVGRCWSQPGALAMCLWYLLVLLVGLLLFQHLVWGHLRALLLSPHDLRYALLTNSLLLLLILGLLRWLALVLRGAGDALPAQPPSPATGVGEAFPSPTTKLVAGWLLLCVIGSVLGVLLAINPPSWPAPLLLLAGTTKAAPEVNEALATLFGAGIGSTITSIMAFFRHASARKDFDRAWAPWYVARPVMGMLLGLVFYFLIRGGLYATVGAKIGEAELNIWSLAGIGALVGLFSKNAIEKLRELFHVLFKVDRRLGIGEGRWLVSLLDGLPPQQRNALVGAMPDRAVRALAIGEPREAERLLSALPKEQREQLLGALPEQVRARLRALLEL